MTINVLVLPDGTHGDSIEQRLSSWVAQGICSAVVLVRADAVLEKGSAAAVPQVVGRLAAPGEQRHVELFTTLARSHAQLVRLGLVQVDPARSDTGETREAGERLADWLARQLSYSQRLVRLNILVPPATDDIVSRDRLISGWDATVVAAPEARGSEDRAALPVVTPPHLADNAALASAIVTGLFAGMAEGPFDHPDYAGDGNANPVVIRPSARILLGGRVVAEVSRAIVEPMGGSWDLPWTDGPRPVASGTPEQAVMEAREDLINCYAEWPLRLSVRQEEPPPTIEKRGIRATLKGFFALLATALLHVPRTLWRWIRHYAATLVGFLTSGSERVEAGAGETATLSSRRHHAIGARAAQDKDAVSNYLEGLARSARMPPTPEIWRTVIHTSLGLVDGSPLPEGISTPTLGASRQVILDPGFIAPDPTVRVLPSSRTDGADDWPAVRACDPAGYEAAAASVSAQRLKTFDSKQRRVDFIDRENPGPAATTDGARPARPQEEHEDGPTAATAAEPEDSGEGHDERVRTALERWTQGRRDSLLWLIADSLHRGRTEAEACVDAATDDLVAIAQMEVEPATAAKSRKRLWQVLTLLFALAAVSVATRFPWEQIDLEIPQPGRVLAWMGVAWLLITYRLFQAAADEPVPEDRRNVNDLASALGSGLGAEDSGPVRRATERFDSQTATIILLAIASIAVLWIEIPVDQIRKLWLSLLVLLTAFISVWFVTRRTIQFILNFDDNAKYLRWRFVEAQSSLGFYVRERARLTSLYAQVVDWAEIIGWVLHHPWGRADDHLGPQGADPDVPQESEGPESSHDFAQQNVSSNLLAGVRLDIASFVVRAAELSAEQVQGVAATTRRQLQRVGWLRDTMSDLQDASRDKYARQMGTTADDPAVDPTVDVPDAPNGSRAALLRHVQEGLLEQVGKAHVAAAASDEINKRKPHELFKDEADTRYLTDLVPSSDPQPLPAWLFRPTAAVDGAHHVTRSHIWLPSTLAHDVTDRHIPGACTVHVSGPPSTAEGSYVLCTARCDITAAGDADGLYLFGDVDVQQPHMARPRPPDEPESLPVF